MAESCVSTLNHEYTLATMVMLLAGIGLLAWARCPRLRQKGRGSDPLVPDFVDADHPMFGREHLLKVLEGNVLLADVHVPHPVPPAPPKGRQSGVREAVVAQLVHQAVRQCLQGLYDAFNFTFGREGQGGGATTADELRTKSNALQERTTDQQVLKAHRDGGFGVCRGEKACAS